MNATLKRTGLAIAVAFALPLTAQANISGIQMDLDGPGGSGALFKMDRWTWTNTVVLGVDSLGAAGTDSLSGTSGTPPRIMVQGQAVGSQFNGSGTPITSAQMGTFTFELSIAVDATRTKPFGIGTTFDDAGATVAWGMNASEDYGSDNYFRLYYSPAGVDNQAGTGFGSSEGEAATAGQQLILDGKVQLNPNALNQAQVAVGNTYKQLDDGFPTPGVNATTLQFTGNLNVLVDVCDSTEILGGSSGQPCSGEAATSTVDSGFFVNTVFDNLALDFDFTGTLAAPFQAGPVPAKVVNQTPAYGTGGNSTNGLNNLTCDGGTSPCDIILEARSASTVWNASIVPEPGTLALLGLGMLATGGAVARRRRNRK